MTEDHVIQNCAPTLANLKTGSLFGCPCESREELRQSLRALNQKLGPTGLRAVPVRYFERKALVYVYRHRNLEKDLSHETAVRILEENGYTPGDCGRCIRRLICRIRDQAEFPHEIGLFLGYPPEDVSGFIENKGCGCKCTGCWKVYGDQDTAEKRFAQFKKCTRVYRNRRASGATLEKLTVAS